MKSLTPYEAQQVRAVAGWKAEPPSYVSGMLEKLTHPLVKLAEKALPENTVAQAIEDAYLSSEVSTHREKVLQRAGVGELHDLWKADLAFCDKLADEFAKMAEQRAMLAGAGTGGGNLLSALVVVKDPIEVSRGPGWCASAPALRHPRTGRHLASVFWFACRSSGCFGSFP